MSLMLLGRQRGEEGVWGEEKRLEVKREVGGEKGSRVQETTGMCRMAGGWPGERTEEKGDCGGVKEQQVIGRVKRKETLTCPLDRVVGCNH